MTQYSASYELSALNGTTGFVIPGLTDNDQLGYAVAVGDINGDGNIDLILGAPSALSNGEVYVLYGSPNGFPTSPSFDLTTLNGTNGFTITGVTNNTYFGDSISLGDVNGDGFQDLLIGGRGVYDATHLTNPGGAYVVFGHLGGFGTSVDLTTLNGTNGFELLGTADHNATGYSVSSGGDLNGDGFDDLIIGAHQASPSGLTSAGSVYVVFGKASGFAPVVDLGALNGADGFRLDGLAGNVPASHPGDYAGRSVASLGDVNGDGFDDIIFGAPGTNNYQGAAYVIFGHSGGFSSTIDLSTLTGADGFSMTDTTQGNIRGAFSVGAAGDVNGDGLADMMVFSRGVNTPAGNSYTGATYVVFGHTGPYTSSLDLSTLNGTNGFRIDGGPHSNYDGFSLSSGDLNGDGFTDLVISAPGNNTNGASSGAVYVVFGTNAGFPAEINLDNLDGTNGFKVDGVQMNDLTGHSVTTADLNRDGVSDLVIGASHAPNNLFNGATYVMYGLLPDAAVTRVGTDQPQTLAGGPFNDTLNGMGGDDLLYGNGGNDTLLGGDGNDGFYFKGDYTSADFIDGGNGTNDQIALQGNYTGGNALTLSSSSIVNVEVMALLPGFNYDITTDSSFNTAGNTFTFWSTSMTAANVVAINGSASAGNFKFFLGQGTDNVFGGSGNDTFYGEGGGDVLHGGGGSNTYAYLGVSDSTGLNFDTIVGFTVGSDVFKLPVAVAGVDATVSGVGLSTVNFDGDMAGAIGSGQMAAGHAVLFTPTGVDYGGDTFLIVDANGVAGYQAGADFVFDMTSGSLAGLSTSSFIT